MKKLFLSALLPLCVALLNGCDNTKAQESVSQDVAIQNADFEAPVSYSLRTINDPPGCGTAASGPVPGWNLQGDGGVADWKCSNMNSRVASLGGGASLSQDTGFNPASLLTACTFFGCPNSYYAGTYVLRFSVANWFYKYPGNYTASLYQGKSQVPFCSIAGVANLDVTRIVMVCPIGSYITQGGPDPITVAGQTQGTIGIRFYHGSAAPPLGGTGGWPMVLDNVSLTFSPVPMD